MQRYLEKIKIEKRLLKLSIILTLFVSIFGIIIGYLTKASSIIFDGIYAALDCLFTIASLGISKLIEMDTEFENSKLPSILKRFQFGFWHFEPFMIAINGISLLIALLYGIEEACILIWNGGDCPIFDVAIIFSIIMIIICYTFSTYEKIINKNIKSEFVAVDIKGWMISGLINIALLIAFIFALFVQYYSDHWIIYYLDPISLIFICIMIFPIPIKIILCSMKEIFLIAPKNINNHVIAIVESFVKKYNFIGHKTYVSKVGRAIIIEIHLILPKNYEIKTVNSLDKIRKELGDNIGWGGPNRWFTVCFTANPKWT